MIDALRFNFCITKMLDSFDIEVRLFDNDTEILF